MTLKYPWLTTHSNKRFKKEQNDNEGIILTISGLVCKNTPEISFLVWNVSQHVRAHIWLTKQLWYVYYFGFALLEFCYIVSFPK